MIQTFEQLLKAKGDEFIYDLFNRHVTVYEKINGVHLSFESINGNLILYRKDDRIPISAIDRVLSNFFDAAIDHLQWIIKTVSIPNGYRFYLEYLPHNKTVDIFYQQKPKNNLFLTGIVVTDDEDVNRIDELPVLHGWAKRLSVSPPPVYFDGMLSDTQKMEIRKLMPIPDLKLLLKVLNPSIEKYILQDTLDETIEALIFKFSGKETMFAKSVDPMFFETTAAKRQQASTPSDTYSIVLIEIHEYILGFPLFRIQLDKKKYDERYVEFICKIFNSFIRDRGERVKRLEFDKPDFLEARTGYDANLLDETTLEYIRISEVYEELFKMFIASYRKKKKKSYGLITDNFLKDFNKQVDRIHAFINLGIQESITSFSEYSELIHTTAVMNFINESDTTIRKNSAIKDMMDLAYAPSERKFNKTRVNLLLVDFFFPFKGLTGKLEKYKTVSNNPIIILSHSLNQYNMLFTDEEMIKIYDVLQAKYPFVKKHKLVNSFNLEKIRYEMKKQNIEFICMDEERISAATLELQYLTQIGQYESVNLFNIESRHKDSSFIEILKNEDYNSFRNYVDNELVIFYEVLKEKIKHVHKNQDDNINTAF